MYVDRQEAGIELANVLGPLPADTLILGIPRGGVVVARAVAEELGLELDVVLARKLRAPMQPELAIGAVGPDGTPVLDERVLQAVGGVSEEYLSAETERRASELAERQQRYRGDRAPLQVEGRTCVVVDDGIATGSTARAALHWLKAAGAREAILAVPVAPRRSLEELSLVADRIVCPVVPDDFFAVGQFYRHFDQVSDDEVVRILEARAAG
ncbi:MAG TPA: phosphoribosyltransferase family protein [Actinomycetota bacterium]